MVANEFNIEAKNVICNDVMLPSSIDATNRYNPHKVRMWLIGHFHGPVCAIFASCEQDALDDAVDANMLDCMLCEDQDFDNPDNADMASLGNAGELFDLSDCWIAEVDFDAARDIHLICKLCRAAAGCEATLDF